jgi:hypothetical protein
MMCARDGKTVAVAGSWIVNSWPPMATPMRAHIDSDALDTVDVDADVT